MRSPRFSGRTHGHGLIRGDVTRLRTNRWKPCARTHVCEPTSKASRARWARPASAVARRSTHNTPPSSLTPSRRPPFAGTRPPPLAPSRQVFAVRDGASAEEQPGAGGVVAVLAVAIRRAVAAPADRRSAVRGLSGLDQRSVNCGVGEDQGDDLGVAAPGGAVERGAGVWTGGGGSKPRSECPCAIVRRPLLVSHEATRARRAAEGGRFGRRPPAGRDRNLRVFAPSCETDVGWRGGVSAVDRRLELLDHAGGGGVEFRHGGDRTARWCRSMPDPAPRACRRMPARGVIIRP